MKISLAEMFESLQNKKTRRKSVKHVKRNILHLKTTKIDKIALFGVIFRICETRETISWERGCLYSGKMHHCFFFFWGGVTAALLLPSGIVVTCNINKNKPRVNDSARRNVNRRRAVS